MARRRPAGRPSQLAPGPVQPAPGDRRPGRPPPYLLASRDELQFNAASDYELDVAAFSAHLAAHAGHAHPRGEPCAACATHLRQALDLYRGRFLHEFFLADSADFEAWALARREALHQRALEAAAELAGHYEQHGDLGATRQYAARQLELDPWSEPAHRQLMRALAQDGQRAAALTQYETCRRVLAEELGVEPSSETRGLYETIRTGQWTPATNSSKRRPRSSFPAQLTPFVGRERELADLRQLLTDPACRCLTLVGPGGIGKTRLALQAALDNRNAFAQGATWVPLAAVHSEEAVIPAIADALGFSFYGPTDPRPQLLSHLRDWHLLLVLDNVEQLLEAAGLFVELLRHTSTLKLLLTSREPLNVQGEWVFEVDGLQLPAGDEAEAIESSAAEALFLQRARRAKVAFGLRAEDRSGVTRLCRLVGGMPLALELAATWVRTLSVPEIVTEIEASLDFLSASVRDLPQRHRSMRAVFDHSWDMLGAEEQRVLRELSAFQGRFRREAAEQVARASLAALSALVAKSLLRRTDTGHYDLHELVRQYAAAHLAADGPGQQDAAERHGRYYLGWLERCTAGLRDRRANDIVADLTAEADNLRAAWAWGVTHHDLERLGQAAPALWYLFELRGWFAEGEATFHDAAEAIRSRRLEVGPGEGALTAEHALRAHAAYFSLRLGKTNAAHAVLLPAAAYLRSSQDHTAAIPALFYLGIVCWELGRYEEASGNLQASLERARAHGDRWYETLAVEFIGIVAHDRGDDDRARRCLTEALANAREMGDPTLASHVLGFLAQTLRALGETGRARELLQEGLALSRETGYRHGIGRALDGLGQLAQATNPEEARTLFAASCDVFREMGDLRTLSVGLSHQGYNSLVLGDITDAQRSFLEVLRLAREGGHVPFALDALMGLALMWAEQADDVQALELVLHTLRDPAATHAARRRAERLRIELETRMPAQQREAARAHSRTRSVAQVVDQLLADGTGQLGHQPPSNASA